MDVTLLTSISSSSNWHRNWNGNGNGNGVSFHSHPLDFLSSCHESCVSTSSSNQPGLPGLESDRSPSASYLILLFTIVVTNTGLLCFPTALSYLNSVTKTRAIATNHNLISISNGESTDIMKAGWPHALNWRYENPGTCAIIATNLDVLNSTLQKCSADNRCPTIITKQIIKRCSEWKSTFSVNTTNSARWSPTIVEQTPASPSPTSAAASPPASYSSSTPTTSTRSTSAEQKRLSMQISQSGWALALAVTSLLKLILTLALGLGLGSGMAFKIGSKSPFAQLPLVSAQPTCPHGFTNYPNCITQDACVWSTTTAICSVTGSTNVAESAADVDGVASAARFSSINGIGAPNYFPTAANSILFLADTSNNAIRMLNVSSNQVTTLAQSAALLNGPFGISYFNPLTNMNPLYSDRILIPSYNGGSIISMAISAPHALARICGTGVLGSAATVSGPCNNVKLYYPVGITIHASGTFAILACGSVIVVLDLSTTPHTVRTVAGSGTVGYADSPTDPYLAQFNFAIWVVFDELQPQTAYVAEYGSGLVRKLDVTNINNGTTFNVTSVTTFAGSNMFFHDATAITAAATTFNGGLFCEWDRSRFDGAARFMYCSSATSFLRFHMSEPNAPSSAVTYLTDLTGAQDSWQGQTNSTVRFNSLSQFAMMKDYVSRRNIIYIADESNNKIRSLVVPPTAPIATPVVYATDLSSAAVFVNFTFDLHGDGGDAITCCTVNASIISTTFLSPPLAALMSRSQNMSRFSLNASSNGLYEILSGSVVMTGLSDGLYSFTVTCGNSVGSSPPSPPSSPPLLVQCSHGYINYPMCDQKDPCVWSTTSAVCSVTGSPNTAEPLSRIVDGTVGTARFALPSGIAAPNYYSNPTNHVLYVTDANNNAIRQLNVTSSQVTTLVLNASLNSPLQIALFDQVMNVNPLYPNHLLVPSFSGGSIFAMNLIAPYSLTRICGTGASGSTTGPVSGLCSSVQLYGPTSITIHSLGLYAIITVYSGHIIVVMDMSTPIHTIRTIAGGAVSGRLDSSSSGLAATFHYPISSTFDLIQTQLLYVMEFGNNEIRRLNLSNVNSPSTVNCIGVSTFAGALGISHDATATTATLTTLFGPASCLWNAMLQFMYCASQTSIIRFDMTNSSAPSTPVTHLTDLAGAGDSLNGLTDASVGFSAISQLTIVKDHLSRRSVLYVVDSSNNKIRSVALPPTPPTSSPIITLISVTLVSAIDVAFTFDLHGDGGAAITYCTATAFSNSSSSFATFPVSVNANVSSFSVSVSGGNGSGSGSVELLIGSIPVPGLPPSSMNSTLFNVTCSNSVGESPSSMNFPPVTANSESTAASSTGMSGSGSGAGSGSGTGSGSASPANLTPTLLLPSITSISPSAIDVTSAAASSSATISVTLIGTNLFPDVSHVLINGVNVSVIPAMSSGPGPSSAAPIGSSIVILIPVALIPSATPSTSPSSSSGGSFPANSYAEIIVDNPNTPPLICPGSSTLPSSLSSSATASCPPFHSGLYFSPSAVISGFYCPVGSLNASSCDLCPANAICPGGNRVQPTVGYYTPDEKLPNIYQCEDPTGERCVGFTSQSGGSDSGSGSRTGCGLGYAGTLCSECDVNYYSDGNVCLSCSGTDSSASPVLITVLTFFFFGSLAVWVMLVSNRWMDLTAIVVCVCQRLLMNGAAIFVYFTPTGRSIFNYFQLIRLDFSYLKGQCSGSEFDEVTQFFISLAVLAIIYPVFTLAALIYQYRNQHQMEIETGSGIEGGSKLITEIHAAGGGAEQGSARSSSVLSISSISRNAPEGGVELALTSPAAVSSTLNERQSFHLAPEPISSAPDSAPLTLPASTLSTATTSAAATVYRSTSPRPLDWLLNPRYPRVIRAMIFVFYITYLQLTRECLSLFHCVAYPIYATLTPPTSIHRLYSDQSVICYSGSHLVALIAGTGILLIAIVATPVGLILYLRRVHQQGQLSYWSIQSRLGFLYRKTRNEFYWYRFITFVLNFISALQAAILLPSLLTQFVISTCVIGLRLLILCSLRPFVLVTDVMRSAYWLLAELAVICFFVFAVRSSSLSNAAILLPAEVLCIFSAAGFGGAFCVVRWIEANKRTKTRAQLRTHCEEDRD